MDIKKLFNQKSTPNNNGNSLDRDENSDDFINRIYLDFADLEGRPTFELDSTLTIGSEVGDIILENPSLSPKHCTVSLNQDVISIMDHGSVEGTFINKKKISPGRIFILQESDKIKMGKISVLIKKIKERISEEIIPSIPVVRTSSADLTAEIDLSELHANAIEEEILEIEDDLVPVEVKVKPIKASGSMRLDQSSKNNKKSKPLKSLGVVRSSSSALVRVIAIILEFVVIAMILTLFKGSEFFQNVLQVFPKLILEDIKPIYTKLLSEHINIVIEEIPALTAIYEDLADFISKNMDILYAFVLFSLLRVISPLIFGCSFGQILLGVRASGSFTLKRILGSLREIIGLVTGPFLIFDISTIFSKRSFKEIITFTQIETPSKIASLILCILLLPGAITGYLIAPMVQDFKIKAPLPVNESVIIMKKIELANLSSDNYSKQLDVNFNFADNALILPSFRINQMKNKRVLVPIFNVYDQESKTYFPIMSVRTFSLKKLLDVGVNSNYLASYKFDKVFSAANSVANTNKNFKQSIFEDKQLYAQIQELTNASVRLSIDNLVDHILEYGPFVKSFVDYREGIERLIGPGINLVAAKQIGDTPFLIFQKGKELLMFPIDREEARVYSVGINNIKRVEKVFKSISWKKEVGQVNRSTLNFVSFVDKILLDKSRTLQFYQNSYELFYNKAKEVMITEEDTLFRLYEITMINVLRLMDTIENKNKDKFVQNMSDLLKAFKDKDKRYFGIKDTRAAAIGIRN